MKQPHRQHSRWWMSWFLGIACIAGVIVIATHYSEVPVLFQLIRKAKPRWLVAALIAQAGTYFTQAEIWRTVGRKTGTLLPMSLLYKLALSKLFVDQALPSAGVSGTVVVAKSLSSRGLSNGAVVAAVVINTTSFFIAYVAALAAALAIVMESGRASFLMVSVSLAFMVLGAGLTAGMLAITGEHLSRIPKRIQRFQFVQKTLNDTRNADSKLVRDKWLQAVAGFYQLLTFLLDAATLWMLMHSLGGQPSFGSVFASFMIANLFRSISLIPGGLGTFEAAVVYMLKTGGTAYSTGLAAALLFRGITFFLPMAPGMWFSQRLNRSGASKGKSSANPSPEGSG
jgi:Mg2+-importing ATPase